jgi:hypothetical protein
MHFALYWAERIFSLLPLIGHSGGRHSLFNLASSCHADQGEPMTTKIDWEVPAVRRISAGTRETMIFPLLLVIVAIFAAVATFGHVTEREAEPTAFDWIK